MTRLRRVVLIRTVRAAGLATLTLALAVAPLAAKVKIKTDYEKTTNFTGIKTWAWLEDPRIIQAGANPDVVRDPNFEADALSPPTKAAVERAMAERGFRLVGAGEKADAQVAVYLIGGIGTSDQVLGQFIPYSVSWGAFVGGYSPTQALRIYEKGTLIFDIIDPAKKSAVWRATAVGEIDRQRSQEQRIAIIGDIVRDVLKKFPPK